MLSLSSIVQVRVNVSTTAADLSAFSTGLILTSASSVPEDGRCQIFASLEDMLAAGFQASDPAALAAAAYFDADPKPSQIYIGLYSSSESPLAVLKEILAEYSGFYGIALCESAAAKVNPFIEGIGSISGRFLFFCGATGSISAATASSGILAKAFETGSDRLLTVYGADIYAPAAVMGTALGLIREHPSGGVSLCYQEIPGMLPTFLTETEIATLAYLNCNTYIIRGASRRLLEHGQAVSGRRFDEILALDMISADLQEAALALITEGARRLPQTDETSALFINRFSAILSGYTAAGVLASGIWRGNPVGALMGAGTLGGSGLTAAGSSAAGSLFAGTSAWRLNPGDPVENGYLLWADSYDLQSDADRAAHKAMPIHCALCLAGSVESLLIDIDVTV